MRSVLQPLIPAMRSYYRRSTLHFGAFRIDFISVRSLSSSPDVEQRPAAAAEVEQCSSGSVFLDVYTRLGIPINPNACNLPDVTEAELLEKIRFLRKIGFDNEGLSKVAVRQPRLLTLDLVEELTPCLLRLESFGLKKTILGKLLARAPFVGGNLSEVAFEERIEALKSLEFSASQIGSILNRLSCRGNRLVRFVHLPLEKISSLLTSVESLGLKKEEARDFVTESPSTLVYDPESHIGALESIMGDRKNLAKLVMSNTRLLKCNPKYLKETVEFMTGLVEKDTLAAYIGEKSETVLLRKQALQRIVEFLEGMGLKKKSALILAIRRPYLVDVGSKRLQRYADFFRNNGLDPEVILKLMEVNPRIFNSSIDSLNAKLVNYKNQGFEGENLNKLFCSHPEVLTYSLERQSLKVEFLEKLGIGSGDSSSTLKAMIGKTVRIKHKGFQTRIDWLAGLGIPIDEVLEMVRKLPSILAIGDSRIEKSVDYLVNTMGYSVQELVSAPTYLCCSLETKIKPRFRVISWLRSTGVLEKNPSLSAFVGSEESFMEKFVDPYPEGLVVYRGDDQAE